MLMVDKESQKLILSNGNCVLYVYYSIYTTEYFFFFKAGVSNCHQKYNAIRPAKILLILKLLLFLKLLLLSLLFVVVL